MRKDNEVVGPNAKSSRRGNERWRHHPFKIPVTEQKDKIGEAFSKDFASFCDVVCKRCIRCSA